MELINTPDIAVELGVSRPLVVEALEALGLKPAYEMPQGKGTVAIWDKAILPQIQSHLEAKKLERAAARAATAQHVGPAFDVETILGPLRKQLSYLDGNVTEILEHGEQLQVEVAKVEKQNVIIFKMLEDMRAATYARLDAMQATLDLLPDLVRTALGRSDIIVGEAPPAALTGAAPLPAPTVSVEVPPKPAKPRSAEPEKVKPKVAIISLLSDQRRLIEQEYAEVFDLRIFEGNDAKATGFHNRISGCDVVFVMSNFVDRAITDQVKKAGVKTVRISGGLTRLRTELTNLFINT